MYRPLNLSQAPSVQPPAPQTSAQTPGCPLELILAAGGVGIAAGIIQIFAKEGTLKDIAFWAELGAITAVFGCAAGLPRTW